ncbi:MAG: tRNA (guanine-N1)-methyltransferase [Thermoplasmata archaeon HGW-Thermoplasmata-2]|nr:MAG: tRNA (guanine-N1)-methyltransferase [Thermoplasmata archaeon HGW-Thermoplasmata-2]
MCVRVPSAKAEEERRRLLSKGSVDTGLKLKREEGFVLIPVLSHAETEFEITEADFIPAEGRKTYQEMAEVPEALRALLPTSFDVIGDIAIIKLKDELLPYKSAVGTAILKANSHVKTVCLDKGVSGEYRVRGLEVIAGEERTETTHVEYGCRIRVDVAKVYFSPRLANERRTMAGAVTEGETIIDMFAGACPFSIMIARFAKPEKIYAIDVNPAAVEYMRGNVRINKVENIVEPICADAREAIKRLPKADRVIMNLPHSAHEFWADAIGALKEKGTINYYEISEKDGIGERIDVLKREAKSLGFEAEARSVRIVHPYSPAQVYFSVEFSVKNKSAVKTI